MYARHALLIIMCASVFVSACTRNVDRLQNLYGPSPKFSADQVSASTTNYLSVLEQLERRAGFTSPIGPVDKAWFHVTQAGFDYVDEQCDAFMDALHWYERRRNGIERQISSTSSFIDAILPQITSSMRALTVTASAFGLAEASVDNVAGVILFGEVGIGRINDFVKKARALYRSEVERRVKTSRGQLYTTPAQAMATIRGYLNQCLPATIAANIRTSVTTMEFIPTDDQDESSGPSLIPQIRVLLPEQ